MTEDTTTPKPEAAPPADKQTEQLTPEPAPVAETKSEEPNGSDPRWLPERLERERRKILRELGAENVSDVKAALGELKDRQNQEKTELERLQARNTELETAATQRDDLVAMVARQSDVELAALTEGHRAAVMAVAGDDPQKRLAAIRALQPTWTTEQKPGAVSVAAPVATAPTSPAPSAASSAASTNHLATLEDLEQTNPVMAAQYRLRHWKAIETAKQARS